MTIISTEATYAALTDLEVVRELWKKIGRVDDDDLSGELYYLSGELLERFTPDLEREATAAQYGDQTERNAEMEAHEESLARRAELRSLLVPLAEREAEAMAAMNERVRNHMAQRKDA